MWERECTGNMYAQFVTCDFKTQKKTKPNANITYIL